MSRPLLQIRKVSSSRDTPPAAGHPRPAAAASTVGGQLRARFGEDFDTAALASQLGCSAEDAQSLQEFWLPREPRPLREHTLLVFARTLDLNLQQLRDLLGCTAESWQHGSDAAAPAAAANRWPAAEAWPGPERDRFADGSPAAWRAPKVIWRKRHAVSPTA